MTTARFLILAATILCGFPVLLVACSDGVPKYAKQVSDSASPEDRIMAAAMTGDTGKVKALLETDPTLVDAVAGDQKTPLHFAAAYGQNEVVTLLLEKGAVISADDDNGEAPIDAALQNGHKDTAAIIRDFAAAKHAAQAGTPQS